MIDKILYQQHVMWYESNMMNEMLDSLQQALKFTTIPVEIVLCLNSQTYLETPIEGNASDMFNVFLSHPVLKNAEIIYKTDEDEFYNIGDWRREIYLKDYKYTVWGESDCLIPEDYFYILSNLNIQEPHTLSFASRIMWDDTWTVVEHEDLRKFPNLDNQKPSYPELAPYRYYDYISINELNEFNNKYDIKVEQLPINKIDGSLFVLSGNLPEPFIAPKLHFVREDMCAEMFFRKKHIPQYCVTTRLKGHNYHHLMKRTNTKSTRDDNNYRNMENLSHQIINDFIQIN